MVLRLSIRIFFVALVTRILALCDAPESQLKERVGLQGRLAEAVVRCTDKAAEKADTLSIYSVSSSPPHKNLSASVMLPTTKTIATLIIPPPKYSQALLQLC